MKERELTYDERATYGECPVCHAQDGEWCCADVGIRLGNSVSGGAPHRGAHLGRLQKAPRAIREVPVR